MQVLQNWEATGSISMDPPPRLATLALLALQYAEVGSREKIMPAADEPSDVEVAGLMANALASKHELLRKYVALDIDDQASPRLPYTYGLCMWRMLCASP